MIKTIEFGRIFHVETYHPSARDEELTKAPTWHGSKQYKKANTAFL